VSGERDLPRGDTLVIQTAFLGDVVLTTGLLTHLAERFGPVDVVTTRAAGPLLETHPAVRRILVYDKRGADRGLGGLLRRARELRRAGYARAYLPHRSIRTAALALLARIPERIGFAGSAGALGYTRSVPRPATGHEAERILALARPEAGARARVALGLTAPDRNEAAAWLDAHGVAEPFVAMAPGSIWGSKRWPGYAGLAARVPQPVVIIGGPEDRALGDAIAAAAPGRVHVAAGALSLRGSAALVERALVLVTNDSAPLHLGSAAGTRTVAIFGPTIPGFGFGPRGAADRIIELNGLPCRPCSRHGPEVCPLGHHRCMQDLRVEVVLDAVRGISGQGSGVSETPADR
jgi:heptosyltransferase-2